MRHRPTLPIVDSQGKVTNETDPSQYVITWLHGRRVFTKYVKNVYSYTTDQNGLKHSKCWGENV